MTELATTAESPEIAPAPSISRARKVARVAGWVGLGLFCLIFFSILKLPEDRVQQFVQSNLNAMLAPRGISLRAGSTSIGILFGLKYDMRDVTVSFPPPTAPAHLDRVVVRPSLLALLTGRTAGSFAIEQDKGRMSADFSVNMTAQTTDIDLDLETRQFNLGKLGLLKALAGVSGSADVTGSLSLRGDLNSPASLDGRSQLSMGQITLDPQNLYGFSLPKVVAPGVDLTARIEKGRVNLEKVQIKTGGDLWATFSGSVSLAKVWDASSLDLKIRFGFSEALLKALVLVDSFLGPGKQPDGSYHYSLTGPINSPLFNPIVAGSGG